MPKFLFNSWFSLAVFVVLVIFVPYRVSFLTLKPYDFWLFAVLFYQYVSGNHVSYQFKGRNLLVRFGIILGATAVLATFLQAISDGTAISTTFVSHFYRFLRFFLVFKLVENIVLTNRFDFSEKFLKAYTLFGTVVFIISFLEYFYIQPYSSILIGLYYVSPDESLGIYLREIGRLSGVMGNSNATAITILSFLIYPSTQLMKKQAGFFTRVSGVLYLLTGIYILIFMTVSRTAILLGLFLIAILLSISFTRLSFFARLIFILLFTFVLVIILIDTLQVSLELSDRLLFFTQGRNTLGDRSGIINIMGREYLWTERLNNFFENGHFLSVITGMGYTKVYKDYADNGLISAFLNLGLIGLIFRIQLYVLSTRMLFIHSIKAFRKNEQFSGLLTYSLTAFLLLLWESTAESIEHIKIGQLLFLFLSLGFVSIAKNNFIHSTNAHSDQLQ